MIAYVDASVLLRVALGQPNALVEWRHIDRGVSSALVTTESLRTLDRVRMRANLSAIEIATRRSTILAILDSLELIEIDSMVLDRAAQPMPTELGTLDAIHLACALLWKDAMGLDLVLTTHDKSLGLAAQAHGLRVLGT
jgi:predicted nucleic acid-binding protein